MITAALPLALTLALVASDTSRDSTQPPAGTPEDQQLWRELQDLTAEAFAQVGRVNQGAFRVRYTKYDEELAARQGAPAAAGEALALRARVDAAMRNALAAIPPDGGRIRACRYALLHFEQRMDELRDPEIAREMPGFRDEARKCAQRMRDLVDAVTPRAAELDTVLAEADAFILRVPRAASPAGPGPSPAAASDTQDLSRPESSGAGTPK